MSTGKLHTHGHGDHDHSHDHHGHHHDHSHDHEHHHHHDDPKHDDHGIDHVFGQDKPRKGEGRTLVVVVVTAVMMVVEIVGGVVFGSMALLADGLHMASHAVALTVTLAAYVLARKYAADRRFSFGTGKINSLAGFASAVLLAGFAAVMVIESVQRLLSPVAIQFDQALIVAVVGLVVNGASALLLGHGHDHDHGHAHGHVHGSVHDHPHGHVHGHDHNLRAAYLHVLADAMTSVLAIVALLAGKMAGWVWLDPVMGVVGAALVAHWSWGLVKVTGAVLLDRQVDAHELDEIRAAVEQTPGARVLDLHVWAIAPGMHAAEIVVENATAAQVRAALPHDVNIVHAVIETRPTPAD